MSQASCVKNLSDFSPKKECWCLKIYLVKGSCTSKKYKIFPEKKKKIKIRL